jgi:hypothetical protein
MGRVTRPYIKWLGSLWGPPHMADIVPLVAYKPYMGDEYPNAVALLPDPAIGRYRTRSGCPAGSYTGLPAHVCMQPPDVWRIHSPSCTQPYRLANGTTCPATVESPGVD